MKEHPILFSTEMVQAILEVHKVQTRRIIKPQPIKNVTTVLQSKLGDEWKWYTSPLALVRLSYGKWFKCPYGKVGDRLWVREGIFEYDGWAWYQADDIPVWANKQAKRWEHKSKTLSARFMPRWASRITLEITDIRVERLQEITEEDAIAEGVAPKLGKYITVTDETILKIKKSEALNNFKELWDSINGKKHSWESNPWVWVIEFKKI